MTAKLSCTRGIPLRIFDYENNSVPMKKARVSFYDPISECWTTTELADMGAHADQPTRDKYTSRGFSEFSEARAEKAALLFVIVSLLFASPLILAGIILFLN